MSVLNQLGFGDALLWEVSVFCALLWFAILVMVTYLLVTPLPSPGVSLLKDGTRMYPMGLVSNVFQCMSEKHSSPLIQVFQLCGESRFEDCLKWAQYIYDTYPAMRCVPRLHRGVWHWKELQQFDIGQIMKLVRVKISAKQESDDDLLCTAFMDFINSAEDSFIRPFDASLPKWNVTVVELMGPKKTYCGVHLRIHHSIADGLSLVQAAILTHKTLFPAEKLPFASVLSKAASHQCLFDSHSNLADVTKAICIEESKQKPKKKRLKKPRIGVLQIVRLSIRAVFDQLQFFFFERRVPHCVLCNATDGMAHDFWFDTSQGFSVKQLAAVSKRYNGSLNDLFTAVFLDAMAQYLSKNEDTDVYKQLIERYGLDLIMRFLAIFNLRALGKGAMDRAVQQFAEGRGANDLAIVPLRLPLGEMSFGRRFELVKTCFDQLKTGVAPTIATMIMRLIFSIGGTTLVHFIMGTMGSNCLGMMSNVMGPTTPLCLGDAVIYRFFNSTNPTKFPFTVGIMSYLGRVHITVGVDKNTMNRDELRELIGFVNGRFKTEVESV